MKDLSHWMEGGSGLTNFQPSDVFIYEETIRRYEEKLSDDLKGKFFIEKQSITDSYAGMYSLHFKDKVQLSSTSPTTIFWRIFEEVNKEYPTEARKLIVKH